VTLDGARVAVLIPAYNESTQIGGVLAGIPGYVDDIVVIDDASTDDTAAVVAERAALDPRVKLVRLAENRGVGGALCEGYLQARGQGVDVAVSLDGDGQMHPDDMAALIQPILDGEADYVKGNRLTSRNALKGIPRVRLFGNSVLTLLTKVVSGYWHVTDSQSGFTAASNYALSEIDWRSMYARYGRPNDVLVLANVADCRVADVPIRPLYGVGERSSMKILRVVFSISMLLLRRFWWRLGRKYVLQDFHPLVFFYMFASMAALASVLLGVRLVYLTAVNGYVPQMTALALAFLVVTTLNSTFFAFWMDKEANDDLVVRPARRNPAARRPPPCARPHVERDLAGRATPASTRLEQ
jgi:glycosyltransferase involved in cell wall biosynthesis